MSLIIEDIRFLNTGLGETVPTNWPLGYIGDVEDVEIDFRYDGDYVIVTGVLPANGDDVLVIGNPESGLTGLIRDDRVLWTDDPLGFEKFEVDDEVTIDRSSSIPPKPPVVRTVLEKVSNQHLLMDSSYGTGSAVVFEVGHVAYVSTKIESVELSHGIIENDEPTNYTSKTDGNDRRAQVEGLDNTVVTESIMEQLGAKSNQFGTLSVRGNLTGDGSAPPVVSQAFTISQKLLIEPLGLADQIDNDRIGIAPPYVKGAASLKYVFKIEASKDLNDPNNKKSVVEGEILGNIGYENELFNGGETNYSVSNVVYTRVSDGSVIKSIELGEAEIQINFDFINTVDAPFSDTDTKIVFEHRYLPTPEDLYREPEFPDPLIPNEAKNRVLKENFFFDRIECTLGTTATTSDNNGGIDQIIKDCTFTYVSNSIAAGLVTIKKSATAVSRIGAATNPEYKLLVSTKDHTLTRAKSDKSKIRVDFNTYFSEVQDPTMIGTAITFVDHVNSDVDAGTQSLIARKEDDIVGIAHITLDRNDITNFNRSDAAINLTSVTAQVIARKDNNTYFVLDEFTTPLNIPEQDIIIDPTYGTVPFIDLTQDRGFITPPDALRQNIRFKRREDLDSGGVFSYELRFPFIFRWEPWEPLSGVDPEFIDITAPSNHHNGRNHDWNHYVDGTGWNIFFRTEINATKNGIALAPYVKESQLIARGYDDGTEWDRVPVKTYLNSTDEPIIVTGGYALSTAENSKIEFDQIFNTTPLPSLAEVHMVMMINISEKTGYKAQYRFYSLYANTFADNPWTGLTGGDLVTKTIETVTTFRAAALIDPAKIPNEATYRVSLRFYDIRADLGDPNGKTLAQGGLKTDLLGFIKDIV